MNTLLEEGIKRVSERGGRMTSQRRLILEALDGLDSHPTAEELFAMIKAQDDSLHLSTVYRTLRWLEQEGLVRARFFGDQTRQERFDPMDPQEHYHFLCTSCNKVIEFNNLLVNAIKAQFELHTGAQVEHGSVVLYGLCESCRSEIALLGPGEDWPA